MHVYDHVEKWLNYYNNLLNFPKTLEGGSGAGQYAKFFKKELYTSFDIEETWYQMIQKPTVYASSDNLPFGDQQFDFAFCVAAFDYFPSPIKSLMEFNRCLKPNGKLVIFTYSQKVLEKIHENCLKLGDNKASINHHVYDKEQLQNYAKEAKFTLKELPFMPQMKLIKKIKLFIKPNNYRNYELTKIS